MARQSREFALREVHRTLFDISSKSSAAHTLRFISPFFSAWQEALTSWLGIASESPQVLARAGLLWNAPNRAGIVYDNETGEKVPPGAGVSPH